MLVLLVLILRLWHHLGGNRRRYLRRHSLMGLVGGRRERHGWWHVLPVGLLDILVLMNGLLGGLLHSMHHMARHVHIIMRHGLVRPLIEGGIVGLELVVRVLLLRLNLLSSIMRVLVVLRLMLRLHVLIRYRGESRVLVLLELGVPPGVIAVIYAHGVIRVRVHVHGLGILRLLAIEPRAVAMGHRAAICHNFIAL